MIPVILDVWREARAKKWFLLLFIGINLFLLALFAVFRLEMVKSALASAELLGTVNAGGESPVVGALRPFLGVWAQGFFFAAILAGVFSCTDFAPSFLSPGRIEYLLGFPISRTQIVLGLFLASVGAVFGFLLYTTLGMTFIFWLKTDVFFSEFLVTGAATTIAFFPIYAAMLLTSLLVRNATVNILGGLFLFVGGILSNSRDSVAGMFDAEILRNIVEGGLRLIPPFPEVPKVAVAWVQDLPPQSDGLLLHLGALTVFLLVISILIMRRQDY